MLKYKKSFLSLASLLIGLSLLSCKKTGKASDKEIVANPSSTNIVFIVVDDMGWDAFGKYPNANGVKAITPTLDSLAKSGITFTNFWVNPECAPTRAAMITGKQGFRTGVGAAASQLPINETIIQKYIDTKKPNTYASAVIGKWHISKANDLSSPNDMGVPYFSGFMSGGVSDYYNWTENTNGVQKNVTTYTTTQFVNESVSWVKQQSKPFFLWLAFNAPHTPFHRPPLDLITDKTLSNSQSAIDADRLTYYLAAIEAMDKEIGRFISSLTTTQKENTIFIVLGDNGTPGQVAQQPFSSTRVKSTLYQGGVNTPLIISGKDVTRKNVTESALVQAPDMFATIADIVGAGSEDYQDSKSIKPFFTNASATKRDFVYSELFGSVLSNNDGYTLRNNNYKLIHLDNGTEYFYKTSTDPFEQQNLLATTLSTEAQQNLDALRQAKIALK